MQTRVVVAMRLRGDRLSRDGISLGNNDPRATTAAPESVFGSRPRPVALDGARVTQDRSRWCSVSLTTRFSIWWALSFEPTAFAGSKMATIVRH
jgi:hypothetical protein